VTVPRRSPLLGQGAVGAGVAAVLAGLSTAGELPLLAGVVVLQIVAVLGFLALVEAPAGGGIFVVTVTAAVAADVVVWGDDGAVGGLAGVMALALVGGLLHQLSRKERARVTEALADTFTAALLACSTVCLYAALTHPEGGWAVPSGIAAAGAAVLAGRLGDRVVGRPLVARGASRTWPGLLLGLGSGVAAAATVAGAFDDVPPGSAALVGMLAAATVTAVDLLIDVASSELTADPVDARRVAALRPVSTLLPFVLLGPVCLAGVLLLERT
jgi:hypothetical protein